MYYPKSQIQGNLYTKGKELVVEKTNKNYKGYYYKTSDGSYYSGKLPNNPTEQKLIPNRVYQNPKYDPTNPSTPIPPVFKERKENVKVTYDLEMEYILANSTKYSDNLIAPLNRVVLPTDQNYQRGQYVRYFLKKTNGPLYKEQHFKDYQKYIEKDPQVQYDLYLPISFTWVIKGDDKNKVGNINLNTLKNTEKTFKIKGLVNYFKGKYSQYCKLNNETIQTNLETDGTEYQRRSTGKPYSGKYHIHPDKGPMVGAEHVSRPHDYLDPIVIERTGSINPPTTRTESFGYGGGSY